MSEGLADRSRSVRFRTTKHINLVLSNHVGRRLLGPGSRLRAEPRSLG